MSFGALGKKIKRTNRSLYEGNKNDNNFRRERERKSMTINLWSQEMAQYCVRWG